jgi:phage/plasmid-like protein (TIGR03299 family)
MVYYGETPWHGLGTEVKNVMTSAEAIKAAKIDWKVEKSEVYYKFRAEHGTDVLRKAEGHYITMRVDTHAALGCVGERYRPIQNSEAFSFMDALVGEKMAMYHTVGSLGKGERVWMLAKVPKDIMIGKDKVEEFLLLSNSHNGWSSLQLMFTPVRVVCQNTLNVAIHGASNIVNIRHTESAGTKVKEARRVLGLAVGYFETFATLSNRMVQKQIVKETVEKFLESIKLGGKHMLDEEGEVITRRLNVRNAVLNHFEHGKGNDAPGTRGTLWALLNGVTEYVDHEKTANPGMTLQDQSDRFQSVMYGSGAHLKQEAWKSAVSLL